MRRPALCVAFALCWCAGCAVHSRPPRVPFLLPPLSSGPAIRPEELARRMDSPPVIPVAAGNALCCPPLEVEPQVTWPAPPAPRRRVASRAKPKSTTAAAGVVAGDEESETVAPDESNNNANSAHEPALPLLGPMLSDGEKNAYQQRLQTLAARTRANVAAVRARHPSPEQQAILRRVEAFLVQAEKLQTEDPVTASSLMERADLLAQDLASRTRQQ